MRNQAEMKQYLDVEAESSNYPVRSIIGPDLAVRTWSQWKTRWALMGTSAALLVVALVLLVVGDSTIQRSSVKKPTAPSMSAFHIHAHRLGPSLRPRSPAATALMMRDSNGPSLRQQLGPCSFRTYKTIDPNVLNSRKSLLFRKELESFWNREETAKTERSRHRSERRQVKILTRRNAQHSSRSIDAAKGFKPEHVLARRQGLVLSSLVLRPVALDPNRVLSSWLDNAEADVFRFKKMADDVASFPPHDIIALLTGSDEFLSSDTLEDTPSASGVSTVWAMATVTNLLLSDNTGVLRGIGKRLDIPAKLDLGDTTDDFGKTLNTMSVTDRDGMVPAVAVENVITSPIADIVGGAPEKLTKEFLLQMVGHAALVGRLVVLSCNSVRSQKLYEDIGFEVFESYPADEEMFMVYNKRIPQATDGESLFELATF